jgi:NADPH:quinone reductase-like Zn-dependent oxidoreductase
MMVAMGHVSDRAIGSDVAGVVKRVGAGVSRVSIGDRVAVFQPRAMCTTLRVDGSLLQKLPRDMSIENGATIPTAFVTAYHALIEIARLKSGESILIHRAVGGKLDYIAIRTAITVLECLTEFI